LLIASNKRICVLFERVQWWEPFTCSVWNIETSYLSVGVTRVCSFAVDEIWDQV